MWEWTGFCSPNSGYQAWVIRAFTCSAVLQPMHRPISIDTAQTTDCFAFKQTSNMSLLSLHGHFRCFHLSPIWGEPSPHLSSFRMPGVKTPFLGSCVVAKEETRTQHFFHHFDYYCYWMASKQATGQVTQGPLRIAPLLCYLDSSAMVPPRPPGDNISPTNNCSLHLHTLVALSVFLWGLHLSVWQLKFAQDRYRVTPSFQLTLKHKGNS